MVSGYHSYMNAVDQVRLDRSVLEVGCLDDPDPDKAYWADQVASGAYGSARIAPADRLWLRSSYHPTSDFKEFLKLLNSEQYRLPPPNVRIG